MSREHRELDGKTRVLTITPYTEEEEAEADQEEAAIAAYKASPEGKQAALERDPEYRAMVAEAQKDILDRELAKVKYDGRLPLIKLRLKL